MGFFTFIFVFFFFKQKTAYEFGSCDWSSDVCSSDLRCDCEPHPHGSKASAAVSQSSDRKEIGKEKLAACDRTTKLFGSARQSQSAVRSGSTARPPPACSLSRAKTKRTQPPPKRRSGSRKTAKGIPTGSQQPAQPARAPRDGNETDGRTWPRPKRRSMRSDQHADTQHRNAPLKEIAEGRTPCMRA